MGRACQTRFATAEEAETRLPELIRGDQQSEVVWEDRIMYTVVGVLNTYNLYSSWVVASYTSEDDAKAHVERANVRAREIDNELTQQEGMSFSNEHDPDHAVNQDGILYEVQEAPFRMAKPVTESQTSVWDQLTRDN